MNFSRISSILLLSLSLLTTVSCKSEKERLEEEERDGQAAVERVNEAEAKMKSAGVEVKVDIFDRVTVSSQLSADNVEEINKVTNTFHSLGSNFLRDYDGREGWTIKNKEVLRAK